MGPNYIDIMICLCIVWGEKIIKITERPLCYYQDFTGMGKLMLFSIRIEQWLPNGTLGEFPIQNQIIKMWKMISIIAIISLKGTSQKE